MFFPSYRFRSSQLDIPRLDEGKLASSILAPLVPWGSRRRYDRRFVGTYHFFCADSNFSALWRKPEKIEGLNRSVCLVEPDFSCTEQCEFPIFLYQLFRRRYLARYWQGLGFAVIPNVSCNWEFVGYVLEGIPESVSLVATSGIGNDLELLEFQFEGVRRLSGREPEFLVYGGGEVVRERCLRNGWSFYGFYRGGYGKE